MVLDLETTTHKFDNRVANPFYKENQIVMYGWQCYNELKPTDMYFEKNAPVPELIIPEDVEVLVGHNIKFDLLYIWNQSNFQNFLKRGGKIFDTLYAEYILSGFSKTAREVHKLNLGDTAKRYGGTSKIDQVKVAWESGLDTYDIDRELLTTYLVGDITLKDYARLPQIVRADKNLGDIGNTIIIYLNHLKRLQEESLWDITWLRMESILYLCECEYNGIYIDKEVASVLQAELEAEIEDLENQLISSNFDCYIENSKELRGFPHHLIKFNLASSTQMSCLFFGGTVLYRTKEKHRYKVDGEWARKKEVRKHYILEDDTIGDEVSFNDLGEMVTPPNAKLIKSGAKIGQPKTKNVSVPGEFKVKYLDVKIRFPGLCTPDKDLEQGATTTKYDEPIYSMSSKAFDIITIKHGDTMGDTFKTYRTYKKKLKDLTSYYEVGEEGNKKGMLSLIKRDSNIIHHSLNNTVTATGRLSSSEPNFQNIPKADVSKVKQMLTSRYPNGKVMEIDFSQLEVWALAIITGDTKLKEDILDGLDQHCLNASLIYDVPYEEFKAIYKDESHELQSTYSVYRGKAKALTFMMQYGAGINALMAETGLPEEKINAVMDGTAKRYPQVGKYFATITEEINSNVKEFNVPIIQGGGTYGITKYNGYHKSITGTLYSYLVEKRFKKLQASPTIIKNYSIQGFGGEIVQVILGRLYRKFKELGWTSFEVSNGDKPLLLNTVHDCIWLDTPDTEDTSVSHVSKICMDIMTNVYDIYNYCDLKMDLPLNAECEYGNDFYTMQHLHIGE